MTEAATAASADGTSGLRPFMRIAADLRRRIAAGCALPARPLAKAKVSAEKE